MTESRGGRRIKKFYQSVDVVSSDGTFAIALDGRPAKTPGRALLSAPTPALAEAMADEWRGEGDAVDFDRMMLTRLASTVIDLASDRRGYWIDEVLNYLQTDLLCHRATTPEALVARQNAAWDPLLDWLESQFGARMAVIAGVKAARQPDHLIAAVRAFTDDLDDWRILGVTTATQLSGSAVIGLALQAEAFSPDTLFAASRVDERFQAEQWGVDAEARAREDRLEEEFLAVANWLRLLRA